MGSLPELSARQDPPASGHLHNASSIDIEARSDMFAAGGRTEIAVLEVLWAEARPLTLGQIARIIGLPMPELEAAICNLRSARLLRVLNTLIESYVPSGSVANDCSRSRRDHGRSPEQ